MGKFTKFELFYARKMDLLLTQTILFWIEIIGQYIEK
jgi:hypothetical protein